MAPVRGLGVEHDALLDLLAYQFDADLVVECAADPIDIVGVACRRVDVVFRSARVDCGDPAVGVRGVELVQHIPMTALEEDTLAHLEHPELLAHEECSVRRAVQRLLVRGRVGALNDRGGVFGRPHARHGRRQFGDGGGVHGGRGHGGHGGTVGGYGGREEDKASHGHGEELLERRHGGGRLDVGGGVGGELGWREEGMWLRDRARAVRKPGGWCCKTGR